LRTLIFILLMVNAASAEVISYFEVSPNTTTARYMHQATKFDLGDFGYVGMEIRHIELNIASSGPVEIRIYDGPEEPVIGQEILHMYIPETIPGVASYEVGEWLNVSTNFWGHVSSNYWEGVVPIGYWDSINGQSWGSINGDFWEDLGYDLHIAIIGICYTAALDQSTWGGIKSVMW